MTLTIVEDGAPAGSIDTAAGVVDMDYDGEHDEFRDFVEGFHGTVDYDAGTASEEGQLTPERKTQMPGDTLEALLLARVNQRFGDDPSIHVIKEGGEGS